MTRPPCPSVCLSQASFSQTKWKHLVLVLLLARRSLCFYSAGLSLLQALVLFRSVSDLHSMYTPSMLTHLRMHTQAHTPTCWRAEPFLRAPAFWRVMQKWVSVNTHVQTHNKTPVRHLFKSMTALGNQLSTEWSASKTASSLFEKSQCALQPNESIKDGLVIQYLNHLRVKEKLPFITLTEESTCELFWGTNEILLIKSFSLPSIQIRVLWS